MNKAFVSYQTDEKEAAGQVHKMLERLDIPAFLAHEHIDVAEEWRLKILEEIEESDIFICLLSKKYYASPWCVQESGIAAFRKGMTIIPLSLDGSIPLGFIGNYQSRKVNPENILFGDLLPGFVKHNFEEGVELISRLIWKSGGYRSAEAHFELMLPHIKKLTDEQFKRLMWRVADNDQVWDAGAIKSKYLPPLLKARGDILDKETREFLLKECERWMD